MFPKYYFLTIEQQQTVVTKHLIGHMLTLFRWSTALHDCFTGMDTALIWQPYDKLLFSLHFKYMLTKGILLAYLSSCFSKPYVCIYDCRMIFNFFQFGCRTRQAVVFIFTKSYNNVTPVKSTYEANIETRSFLPFRRIIKTLLHSPISWMRVSCGSENCLAWCKNYFKLCRG